MNNYFNTLTFMQKLQHLKKCRLMEKHEFSDGIQALQSKKITIVGCGSQGLNQGLNMRDSGINVVYALKQDSIINKNKSWMRAKQHGFSVGTYDEMIPQSDLIINLTPDKNHTSVIQQIEPLIKYGATLGYSHGFHIVEIGKKIRPDITVIMVAPKCPGTEVRQEYQKGFGVPALIAVHEENNMYNTGITLAKAWSFALGCHKAGVLESSFIAEVKSDLMGEQTVLCGMLQTGSIICFDHMTNHGINHKYASNFIQNGWEVITESLKQGGITLMMDRLSNSAKIRAHILSKELKKILQPIFEKHMNNILNGTFSKNMIADWNNNDAQLLEWREQTNKLTLEQTPIFQQNISEQTYFDNGVLMVAIVKASVELSFETMIKSGISAESAYYESLHELPLIANTIARKRLYEMNIVISDTAEYGNYLFCNTAVPLLKTNFMSNLEDGDIGTMHKNIKIDNIKLRNINNSIRNHTIEKIGVTLRNHMTNMKNLSFIQK
ncbi:ketol-acid reductoisomerase [Candidatus Blochmannia ocreatus (nom. nud.)]|uniref:Ketol-acid reductoisomerase (NADP(+)) n=1 Tax=Candidatus Blochmannia ocreatus (nom. nud.) TaxID=251538 RepID=A0ABY4SVI0_9ENTR|nr:ketol-acid reductoisomerase [Candidatus Blochmannia ocreatus]URJ25434.1 ketol-acid reductoisomerase [Candidatus Blochmannia ocreatus]